LLVVRAAVSKELEKLRVEGTIGSALDASVTVFADGDLYNSLSKLGEELRFALITSAAFIEKLDKKPDIAELIDTDGLQLAISASSAEGTKCVRCWHHQADVGNTSEHPELCGRCVVNVDGSGESRKFA